MEPSEVVGGLCVKQDGYIITFFKEGLDGPPVCKIKKVGGEPFKPG